MRRIINKRSNALLLIIEVLILLGMLSSIFRPLQKTTLLADSFRITDSDKIVLNDSVKKIESDEILMLSGAYTVNVYYELHSGINKCNGNELQNTAGYMEMISFSCPAALHASSIRLSNDKNISKETIWINYGAKLSDFKVTVNYEGNGILEIERIEIDECYIYRLTRFFGVLLFFLLFDMCYLFFVSNKISGSGKKILSILILIFAASSIPTMGNIVYYGHDLEFHLNRIASLANELEQGQFPVRIYRDMLNGYGYATPLFYPDTFLYVPALLYIMKIPLGMCYQIYVFLINLCTVIFSYYCFKSIFNNSYLAGVTGAYLYVLAPYRLINIYTRAAVGEYTAMTFLPLIIMGAWRVYSKDKSNIRDYGYIVIGLTGVFQSHIISTLMVAIFIALYCVLEWRKTIFLPRLWSLVKAFLTTLLVNAGFIVPLFDSMGMDIKSNAQVGCMQEQGLYPIQWGGIFFSATGKSLKNTTYDEMGFSLGVPLCMGVILGAYLFYSSESYKNSKIAKISWTLGIVALLFTSRYFPWDILTNNFRAFKYLCVIQYPWRYLSIASIILSVTTVAALVNAYSSLERRTINYIVVGAFLLSVVSVGHYFWDYTTQSVASSILSEQDRNVFYIGNEEYLLIGSDVDLMTERTIKAPENVDINEKKAKRGFIFECNNKSNETAYVTLPIINYEHYCATDRKTGEYFTIKDGENRCIELQIPPQYNGEIYVFYYERMMWKISFLISAVTISGSVIRWWLQWKKDTEMQQC